MLIFYQAASGLLVFFLLVWGAFCLYQMALIDREVRQNWPRLEEELYDDDDDDYDYGYSTMEDQAEEAREEEERQNSLAAVFKSWLLIVGIFEMMLVFFQVSSSYY